MRENGGQYTHAAVWVVMAVAALGSGDEAVELFHLLNPINHNRTAADVERYKAEPYVLAGDVYAHPQHAGRGGWSWYTGAAGWLYRAGLESILGLRRHGATFEDRSLHPHLVARVLDRLALRPQRRYEIAVTNPQRRCRGVAIADARRRASRSERDPAGRRRRDARRRRWCSEMPKEGATTEARRFRGDQQSTRRIGLGSERSRLALWDCSRVKAGTSARPASFLSSPATKSNSFWSCVGLSRCRVEARLLQASLVVLVPGQGDEQHLLAEHRAKLGSNLVAVHVGQTQVQQHDLWAEHLRDGESAGPVGDRSGLVPLEGQDLHQRLGSVGLVIDDEDPSRRDRRAGDLLLL